MRLLKAIKVFGSGASVVGFGYLLMRFTTPTDEELVNRLSPDLRKKYEEQKDIRKEQNELLYKKIREGSNRKGPKDFIQEELETEREIRAQVLQRRLDNERNAERDRLRQLAQKEQETK